MRSLAKFTFPILFAVALVAGCGGSGGSASVGSNDVAVVGGTHITKKDYDALIAQAKQSLGKTFPKQGTTEYEALKSKAVTVLLQNAERTESAATQGIKITDKQVEARLTQIKKQYFNGSETKYLAQLKQQHLTDALVRTDVRQQLVNEAINTKITKDVVVTDGDVHDYYIAHPQLYSKAQTRDVRHILVKTKPQADSIYAQLKAGNDKTWCTLAKKFSQDPSSKDKCGKLTVSKGQTVPKFDEVAFTEKTKTIHPPIHDATYGWFVIEPLSIVHPRSTTPEKQVASTIKTQLLTQKKDQAVTTWFTSLTKTFCTGGKIRYQVGYTPSPDPCASTTSTNTSPEIDLCRSRTRSSSSRS
jgi:parvulin-like peptidyl-prolyl isomerase